jgi:hypothetical protein
MNSVELYKYKNDTKCMILNDTIVSGILDLFSKSNIKIVRGPKKQINVMKTNKIQAKKELDENKLIMIMNKISDNNINELIGEYIGNILVDTLEKYEMIQFEILQKMIKDIKFINNYIQFTLKIFIIEKQRLNILPIFFIDNLKETIESSNDEMERNACFQIIKCFHNNNFFNENVILYMSNKILNSDNIIDIYNWFNGLNIDKYKNNILDVINKCDKLNLNREKILLESLIDKNIKVIIPTINNIKNEDIFITSINNILDEYLFIKSTDEIIEFIKTECVNINEKNILCREILYQYTITEDNDLFKLLENLVKHKVLFKSNISKGLLLLLNNNIQSKYIIDILKFLKNNNITKNIENLFKKYKVKLYYDC